MSDGGSEHETGGPFFDEELFILQLIECLLYFAPNLSSQCSLHLNLKKQEENEPLAWGPGMGVWEEHVVLEVIVH